MKELKRVYEAAKRNGLTDEKIKAKIIAHTWELNRINREILGKKYKVRLQDGREIEVVAIGVLKPQHAAEDLGLIPKKGVGATAANKFVGDFPVEFLENQCGITFNKGWKDTSGNTVPPPFLQLVL